MQMGYILTNLFQISLWKDHARRKVVFFGLTLIIIPKIQAFQALTLLQVMT